MLRKTAAFGGSGMLDHRARTRAGGRIGIYSSMRASFHPRHRATAWPGPEAITGAMLMDRRLPIAARLIRLQRELNWFTGRARYPRLPLRRERPARRCREPGGAINRGGPARRGRRHRTL